MTPGAAREALHHDELCRFNPLDHELGDAFTAFDLVVTGLVGVVEHNTDLTPVPGINRTWGVEHCDPVLRGQTRTGVDESHITRRKRQRDASRDEAASPRGNLSTLPGVKIQAGISRPGIGGHREFLVESLEQHRHGFVVSTTLFYICHSTDPTGIRVILETC